MEPAPAPTRPSGSRRVALGAGVVILALGAGALGGLVARSTTATPAAPSTSTTTTLPAVSSAAPASCPVEAIASKDLKSVVTIYVRTTRASSTGSGEVIRANGYILTNNHVIATAASGGKISVLFDNGKSVAARLVGRDPLTDLAVIRVHTSRPLPTITFGSSAALHIGEPVVALGAPLGLSSTVTAGIVSALDRSVTVPGEGSAHAFLIGAIQTDAAINPGNSGGALVNCAGELVGIPSAGATVPNATGQASSGGDIGLGFAIPVDMAKTISDEIITTGKVTHAYLGLDAEPLSAATGQAIPGLYVTSVDPGGPAAAAGIKVGDVVTKIDGTTAISTDQLVEVTLRDQPGTKVALELERNGRPRTATVVLGTEP